MIPHARRAFAAVALPVLVSVSLGMAPAAQASEGHALAATDRPAPEAAPMEAAAPVASVATPPKAGPAVAARAVTPPAPNSPAPKPPAPEPIAAGPVWTDASGDWRQDGLASWYGGRRWQGRLTASGVRYDDRKLTAAHASLPLGSRVRVTVADTGRSVVVTINDRPGTRRRIIDLSRAAAAELGIVARGIARVALSPT